MKCTLLDIFWADVHDKLSCGVKKLDWYYAFRIRGLLLDGNNAQGLKILGRRYCLCPALTYKPLTVLSQFVIIIALCNTCRNL